jgi:type IV pilus assembly protein PilP
VTKESPQSALTLSPDFAAAPTDALSGAPPFPIGGYDPAGRRDPFSPVLSQLAPGQTDPTLPPLQRIGLTDLNLIAIIWGAYGYTAMVQTPDGNGYTAASSARLPRKGLSCKSGLPTCMAENRSASTSSFFIPKRA